MKNQWIAINLAGDGAGAEISVRGFIGSWWDEVNDTTIAAQLAAIGDVEEIRVSINSRGGEVDPAVAIYNMLRNHPARVVVRVEGVAASAASIIAMAGDEIVMPANTLMMVHNPLTAAIGDADDMRAAAEMLDTYRDALLETYAARTGLDEEALTELLDAETWMTAREALEMGFADRVEELATSARKTTALAAFASAMQIPAAVLAKVEAIEAESATAPAADDLPAENPASDPMAMARAVFEAANAAGLAAHAAQWLDCADLATARAAIAEAREVKALCAQHKLPALADSLIAARTPIATARALVLQAKAAADESIGEINARPGHRGDGAPAKGVPLAKIYSTLNANVR